MIKISRLKHLVWVFGALLIFHSSTVADTYPKNHKVDIQHYQFAISLNDSTDRISCIATIDVQLKEAGIRELNLDLINLRDDGKGMVIEWLRLNGTKAEFSHDQDRVNIALPASLAVGQPFKVTIKYEGIPATGLIIGPNKYGDRTFFSDNWPDKARHWLPTVDHPYEKASSEFIVTAPSKYSVISNGLKLEESVIGNGMKLTHWKQSVPISNWLYVLGVAEFAIQYVDEFDGKSIQTWVYHQDREPGFYDFAVPTKQALQFYSDKVGPFAYEKLANIQSNSVGGGMEAASAILYGDNSVTGERTTRWRNVIVHEVAHQWFGNCVTESDWDDVWLSEGFATYFTLLFIEDAYGKEEFITMLKESRTSIKDFFVENPAYRIVHDNLNDMSKVTTYPGTYLKGAWVLHMLRHKIGDDNFWRGFQNYYNKYYNSHATTALFKKEMEEVSEQDLDPFFTQWLYVEGNPSLNISWKYSDTKKEVSLKIDQQQLVFKFPIEVQLLFPDGQSVTRELDVNESKGSFKITANSEPVEIVIDPNTKVVANWSLLNK